jgi:TolB-like protein
MLGWAAVAIVAVLGAGAAIAWYIRTHSSAPIGVPSLVVIPAEVTGPAQSAAAFEYLKDAVPATLSTRLSSVPGVETKVPPSTVEWDAVHHDVQHIVQAYAVHYYVAPHVVAEANRLSMTLQLVDGATRKIAWSGDYAGAPDSYLTFIGQAADDLRDYLRAGGGVRTTSAGGARTSEAELAFQEGHRAWHRFNSLHKDEDFDAALATLKRALTLDSMLANAAAEIAWLYEFRWEAGRVEQLERTDVEHWAREALRIDSHCGLATSALAYLEISKPKIDLANAIRYGLKGANDAPRDALAQNLAGIAVGGFGGAAALALASQHEALTLDPFYRAGVNNEVATLFGLNRSPEALVLLNELISRAPETRDALWGEEFLVWSALGRTDDAHALLARHSAKSPAQRRLVEDIIDLLERGNSAADQKLESVFAYAARPGTTGLGIGQAAARLTPFLVKHGRIDGAIRLLDVSAIVSWLPRYDSFVSDERLTPLRRDPRAAPILVASKARLMQTLAILDQARADGQLPAYFVQPLADLHAKFGS